MYAFCLPFFGSVARADDTLLAETWAAYRDAYIQDDGRVIDPGSAGRSTSEGQAYALVRALWAADPATFERVRAWTVGNLQAGDAAKLPAWSWGQSATGRWEILDPMPAADADEWMAWALLGAARRWNEPRYREQGLALLAHVWDEETLVFHDTRLLLPGRWAATTDPLQLNPSYWLIFAWRTFAREDPVHDWASLIGPAYTLLDTCRAGYALPPDWCYLRGSDGAVLPAPRGSEGHEDFGFEAFRVGWTLAAEVRWYKDPRAKKLLRDFGALGTRWQKEHALPGILTPDGRGRVPWSYQGLYGALLPVWGLTSPTVAEAVATEVLTPTRAEHGWGARDDYYGQNWIWLGYALWQGVATPTDPP